MKILIANRRLREYSGTEVVTRDLAAAFRALGHAVRVYSPWPGDMAAEMRAAGTPVDEDLRSIREAPDIIHGNHPKVLLESLLRFPGVPAVAVCHDAGSIRDEPFAHPRIFRYIGVDNRCRARFEAHALIPPERIGVVWNAVDLERFRPRPPLPSRPSSAVVFSNYATRVTHLPAVRSACRRMGLRLDVIGSGVGRPSARPETVLPGYDVVIAKARCALEAMAVGCAVVLCDYAGLGPMVTVADFDRLRAMNFGQAALEHPVRARDVAARLREYDAAEAARVSARVRAEAGLDQAARAWLRLYEDVLAEAAASPPSFAVEQAALLDYVQRWSYEARVEWEHAQIRRLGNVPLVGRPLQSAFTQVLRAWLRRRRPSGWS